MTDSGIDLELRPVEFARAAAGARGPDSQAAGFGGPAATEVERRVLIDEFVESITVLPDHIEVNIHGARRLHVLYQEVGLKESQIVGVGGGT
jgi:hypothetical protein